MGYLYIHRNNKTAVGRCLRQKKICLTIVLSLLKALGLTQQCVQHVNVSFSPIQQICIVSFNKFFFFVERVLRYSPVLLVSEIALLGDVETDRRRAGYPDNMAVASQHTGQRSNQT